MKNKLINKCRQCIKFKDNKCSYYNDEASKFSIICKFDSRIMCKLCKLYDTKSNQCKSSKITKGKFRDDSVLRVCKEFINKG